MPTRLPARRQRTATACPLCGGATSFRLAKNDYTIVRCSSCRFEFVDPIPDDDELRAIYDDEAWYGWTAISRTDADVARLRDSEVLPEPQRRAYDEILDTAETLLGRKGSLLEVGCGNGPLLLRARDRGWDCHGLETSEWAVGFDNDVLGLDVRRGVLEDHSFEGERFDVVAMIHSLEHMPRPVQSLRAVHDLLAPGGVVRIEVPNLDSLGRRVTRGEWRAYVPPSHLWYYTHGSLAATLRAAGFEAFDLDNRGFSPGIWKKTPHAGDADSDVAAGDAPSASSSGATSLASRAKSMLRVGLRKPLQSLWMLDALGTWARVAPDH